MTFDYRHLAPKSWAWFDVRRAKLWQVVAALGGADMTKWCGGWAGP